MAEKLTPYQWLLKHSYSDSSLKYNIDKLVKAGYIDEGDAYDYYRDLRKIIISY